MLVSDPRELIIHPDLWVELNRANSGMQRTGWLTELKKLNAGRAALPIGDDLGDISFASLRNLLTLKGVRKSDQEWKQMEDKLETDRFGNVYICVPPSPPPLLFFALCHN